MRLLNVGTRQLQEFFGDEIPPYAILSHTWGKEEVTFQDLQTLEHKSKQGYVKIEQTCRRAARKGCEWVWIDTCCIDKSSSAELSEAINSMFEWYQKAEICYVFLADVPPSENLEHIFRQARWLTRGWTLQEFLAPRFISLLNSEWEDINPENFPFAPLDLRRVSFEQGLLGYITGINVHRWRDADIPTKLSWAARRQTSRTEDMAYCLLGLLDINMPLLYGEGTRAFTRLLEEVMKRSNSHGLLAAGYDLPVLPSLHLLPKSPRAYAACAQKFSNVPVFGTSKSLHFSMTNAGLNIELPLVNIDNKRKIVLGLLNCRDVAKLDNPQLAIALRQANDDRSDQLYYPVSQPLSVPSDFHQSACRENIYIADSRFSRTRCLLALYYKGLKDIGYQFHSLYPPSLVETIIDMDTSYIYSEAADTLVLLFTTVIHRPNIVFLVPASYAGSTSKPLVSLTNSVSLIEFLLRDEIMYNQKEEYFPVQGQPTAGFSQSSWSNQIDIDLLQTRNCWRDHVVISMPQSGGSRMRTFRISLRPSPSSSGLPDWRRIDVVTEEFI